MLVWTCSSVRADICSCISGIVSMFIHGGRLKTYTALSALSADHIATAAAASRLIAARKHGVM